MKKAYLVIVLALLVCSLGNAQDSTVVLQEVEIESFRYRRPVLEIPASVSVVSSTDLNRFSNTSLLPALNINPGIRMEERSPGSYRLSIRGSLIRSPFGVRNVKIYWNSLPFTDAGGNTYLNLLDLSAVEKVEILKGPGGSLYGAGTGGVVLFSADRGRTNTIEGSIMGGSNATSRLQLKAGFNNGNLSGTANFSRQHSDGYREHTMFDRTTFNSDFRFNLGTRSTLAATVLFSDVFYRTPGGLTLAQFSENPKQSRPAAGPNRSAREQNASVKSKNVYAGVVLDHDWTDNFSTTAGLYTSFTNFRNYAIGNVEDREENNAGLRIENQLVISEPFNAKFTFGTEYQVLLSPVKVYENNFGQVGAMRFYDDLRTSLFLLFSQAEITLPYDFMLTAGISGNFPVYSFTRLYPARATGQSNVRPEVAPRVALLRKVNSNVSVHGSISRGFSPPTLAEIRPSTNVFDENLRAERGTNYEIGTRGNLLKGLFFDITAYRFSLKETIVQQRDDAGAEFFTNAGRTDQRGVESFIKWSSQKRTTLWMSYTYNHYRFDEYNKDGNSFSGNRLTGVPASVFATGLDYKFPSGLYFNVTLSRTSSIPLNDANTAYAGSYFLASIRTGYKFMLAKNSQVEIFTAAENLLDEQYSLGNDLNAFGERFYNLAPGRQFFAGLRIEVPYLKK